MVECGIVSKLKGKLIVSCQAYPGEPMRHPETMSQIALSAQMGGAGAIRCQGLADISAIKGQVSIPVIGIWKEGDEGVYITPTLRHARACIAAGADIVALDATSRPRPDGLTLRRTVQALQSDNAVLMADCGCIEDARHAHELGFNVLSTTLSGYTANRPLSQGPDFELLETMIKEFPDTPVICEGRIRTPQEARRAMDAGAWAIVVGTAITHPMRITRWYAQAIS
ncbi:MAG: N-acetylmannosamine-6-phosphate 2-epimerase [Bifidobacterium sp.]|jgi:N-acylglucosamine-6-phosphate 2-epimerase